MERTKRDQNQIVQFEHDEASNAKRVKMVGTEMSIELDHTDGDSVTAHPAKLSASSIGVEAADAGQEIIPPLDCSSIRHLRVDVEGAGNVRVEVSSADQGDHWREVSSEEKDLCARRVRVICVDAVGNVHLVGKA